MPISRTPLLPVIVSPVRAAARRSAPAVLLTTIIAGLGSLDFGRFRARNFSLYQSTLKPTGSVYTKLAEFPLIKS